MRCLTICSLLKSYRGEGSQDPSIATDENMYNEGKTFHMRNRLHQIIDLYARPLDGGTIQ